MLAGLKSAGPGMLRAVAVWTRVRFLEIFLASLEHRHKTLSHFIALPIEGGILFLEVTVFLGGAVKNETVEMP